MFWLCENNIVRLSQVKDFGSDWVITKLILKMNIEQNWTETKVWN